ncbi:MAG: hypothetical protein ABSA59_14185 [Terriglobia bacterium]
MQPSKPVLQYRFPSLPRMLSLSLLLLFATTAVAQQQGTQDLLSQADEVFQQMSQITGLPIKTPLRKQVVSRPEIEKYLTQNLHEEMTPEEIHAQEALVRAFGLVSRDFNLEKFLISFYTEQAAGFYDPKRKTMFIADWIPAETQTMVLSHELTHALQDQSWDLESYLHGARDNDDATDARQAVVEGYATAAMLQQATGPLELGQLPSLTPLMEMVIHQEFEDFPAFSNAPYFFRMEALFPYVQGMGFIQAGLQLGGWKDLKLLFEHPPEATKQIFEPQTYYHHQAFPKIAVAHPPALEGVAGLRFLSENAMGELGYYCLLGQLISEDEAQTLGPSWLADRYLLYERSGGNDYTLVARTRWTTPETSLAFFRDYHTILAHKYPELTPDKRSSTDMLIGSAANGVTLLLRKGDECVWAEGVPAAKADAMLAWLRAL